MQIYDCTVRLGGSLHNEVLKTDVTAAEVILLRHIHGEDAVVNLKAKGSVDRKDREERARLSGMYSMGSPAMLNPDDLPGAKLVRDLFGVDGVPLPQKLDEIDVDIEPEEPVVRRRVSRAPKSEAEAAPEAAE